MGVKPGMRDCLAQYRKAVTESKIILVTLVEAPASTMKMFGIVLFIIYLFIIKVIDLAVCMFLLNTVN
jgi:hypothetical protein